MERKIQIADTEDTKELSRLSVSLGNVPFFPGKSIVAFSRDAGEVTGFAAVQIALHAAGSWVKPEFRRQGHSYELRSALDRELRRLGFPMYFALPGNEFEKDLFRKYGEVTERLAQVRSL